VRSNLSKIVEGMDVRESFVVMQVLDIPNPVCAEIGTWVGKNAEIMLDIDPTMTLHCIDAYTNVGVTEDYSEGQPEEVKAKAVERLKRFGDRVKLVYQQSEVAYSTYPDEYFDYIYIDGDHSYFGAYRDMRTWWPKVKKGGLLGGHDVAMGSVSKALIDFADDNCILPKTYKIIADGRSDWWVEK
jgi:hypothetical protein